MSHVYELHDVVCIVSSKDKLMVRSKTEILSHPKKFEVVSKYIPVESYVFDFQEKLLHALIVVVSFETEFTSVAKPSSFP